MTFEEAMADLMLAQADISYRPKDDSIDMAIIALKNQKTGHWIFKNDNIAIPTGYYQCSECEEGKLLNKDNFCPNCGAKMKLR